MKKTSLILLLFLLVSSEVYAFSYSEAGMKASYDMGKLGVLKAEVFEDDGELTRYEVLKTIMIAISGNENCDYGDISDTYGMYQDFETDIDVDYWLKNEKFLYEYSNGSTNFIALAFYNGIAQGYVVEDKVFFMFEKKATVIETLTFMARCLTGESLTMEQAYDYAKEKGLIASHEIFYDAYYNTCENIKFDYFCILLERFVNQPRGIYLDSKSDKLPSVLKDCEGLLTYKEYILQKGESI